MAVKGATLHQCELVSKSLIQELVFVLSLTDITWIVRTVSSGTSTSSDRLFPQPRYRVFDKNFYSEPYWLAVAYQLHHGQE